tara:strand:- start:53349 stop:54035 length:687 start_codon:yes stop_codon:yes gene_type:complete
MLKAFKMKTIFYILLLCISILPFCNAQQIVSDPGHTLKVVINNGYRVVAERKLENETQTIKSNTNKIRDNVAKLLATKALIYKSLTEVNEVIKDGREVKYIGTLVTDIFELSTSITGTVFTNPELVLVSNKAVSDMKTQAMELYGEIAGFIAREGRDAMMDVAKRDELLRSVTLRLQIIRGVLYGLERNLYWAGVFGTWNSINPFASYISYDKLLIDDIMFNLKTIKE